LIIFLQNRTKMAVPCTTQRYFSGGCGIRILLSWKLDQLEL
jgi:hypothetical protein